MAQDQSHQLVLNDGYCDYSLITTEGVLSQQGTKENTWYGVILWVLRVLGQGLNQCARIFFIRAFSGFCDILTSPKKGETAVYGYNPALF